MNTLATSIPSGFVDFKEIKSQISISEVIERYGLLDSLKEQGDRLSGPCPIHQGSNVTQFRVSVSKNCFNCFGSCGRGGNIIDFVSLMEEVSFRDAALLLKEWFFPEKESSKPAKKRAPKFEPKVNKDGKELNAPLTFSLKNLDPEHPYLKTRGISDEAVEHFGLGFCKRGCLKDHVVIPIHNLESELVGYVGRFPEDPSGSNPKYRFPKGFKKSLELFNLHRALQEPSDHPLVLVEGFFDCIALWEAGIWKCAALMGSHLSDAQATLLEENLNTVSCIDLLFDSDEAGEKGAEKISDRLSDTFSLRNIELPRAGMQPDSLDSSTLVSLFE